MFRVFNRMFGVFNRVFRVFNRVFRVFNRVFRVVNRVFRVFNRVFRVLNKVFKGWVQGEASIWGGGRGQGLGGRVSRFGFSGEGLGSGFRV